MCPESFLKLPHWNNLRLLSCVIVAVSVTYHSHAHYKVGMIDIWKDSREFGSGQFIQTYTWPLAESLGCLPTTLITKFKQMCKRNWNGGNYKSCDANLLTDYSLKGNHSPVECVVKHYTIYEARFCIRYQYTEERQGFLFVGDKRVQKIANSFVKQLNLLGSKEEIKPDGSEGGAETLLNFPDVLQISSEFPDSSLSTTFRRLYDLDLLAQTVPTVWLLSSNENSSVLYKCNRKVKKLLKGTHVKIWEAQETTREIDEIRMHVLYNLLCNKFDSSNESLCCNPSNDPKSATVRTSLLASGFLILFIAHYTWETVMTWLESKSAALRDHFAPRQPLEDSLLARTDHFAPRQPVEDSLLARTDHFAPRQPVEDSLLARTDHFAPRQPLEDSLLALTNDESATKQSANPVPNEWLQLPAIVFKSVLIFGYFYICDRTDFFKKSPKRFSTLEFSLPLLWCLVIGITFRGKSPNGKILNRDITDEWKGWMQLVILVYHVTRASGVLQIYMHVRILVSSYLFMTGFGNLCYFWQGGKMTFRRYCQVMLRMNFLVIVLCIVMDRPYQFYYFVPLVSFWYSVLHLLFSLPPQLTLNAEGTKPNPTNEDYIYGLVKLAFLFGIVTGISLYKEGFDSLFTFPVWAVLFVMPGAQDKEWWFRFQLDKYSVLYGALYGMIYKYLSSNEENGTVPANTSYLETILKYGRAALGIAMIFTYSSIFLRCNTKQDCNSIHPYVVAIPILGFILLRNFSKSMRVQHSLFLVAAGKISLELFVCQYHVWLAADSKGRLVLLQGYPVLNMALVSVVFTSIAYEVHQITDRVTQLVVVKDVHRFLINLFFLVGLAVIGKMLM